MEPSKPRENAFYIVRGIPFDEKDYILSFVPLFALDVYYNILHLSFVFVLYGFYANFSQYCAVA
jgi:hypothetical protein